MEPLPNRDRIPYEWEAYITQSPIAMMVSPWCMYSTVKYLNQPVIDFFQESTNVGTHGMLYNPTSFLIQSIKIYGAKQLELNHQLQLIIGNRICYDSPIWSHCLRESQKLTPCLMIPPLCTYRVRIQQKENFDPKVWYHETHPITVALFGQVARAIQ